MSNGSREKENNVRSNIDESVLCVDYDTIWADDIELITHVYTTEKKKRKKDLIMFKRNYATLFHY